MLVTLFPVSGIFANNTIIPGYGIPDAVEQIQRAPANFGLLNNNGSAIFSTGAGTTEQTAFTYTVPTGLITQAGQQFRIRATGTRANNANTVTVKLYFGATSFSVVPASGAATNWEIAMDVYVLGLAAQAIWAKATQGTTVTTQVTQAGSDTIAGVVIKTTITDTTNSAGDGVCLGMTVDALV